MAIWAWWSEWRSPESTVKRSESPDHLLSSTHAHNIHMHTQITQSSELHACTQHLYAHKSHNHLLTSTHAHDICTQINYTTIFWPPQCAHNICMHTDISYNHQLTSTPVQHSHNIHMHTYKHTNIFWPPHMHHSMLTTSACTRIYYTHNNNYDKYFFP